MASIVDHVRAAVSGDDAERLAKRREIRQQLATLQLQESRAAILATQLTRLDREIDAAADRHKETCQPLQSKLLNVESRINTALVEQEEISSGDEAQRAAILQKISDANLALEIALDGIKKQRKAIETERIALLRSSANRARVEAELKSPPAANPQLLRERHVCTQSIVWAGRRVSEAKKAVEALELQRSQRSDRLDGRELVPDEVAHARRLNYECALAQCECDEAERLDREARARLEQIRRAILEE